MTTAEYLSVMEGFAFTALALSIAHLSYVVFNRFFAKKKPYLTFPSAGARLTPSDLLAGDVIKIKWDQFGSHNQIGEVTVMDNDQIQKTLLISIRWIINEKSLSNVEPVMQYIFSHSSKVFEHLHLLNHATLAAQRKVDKKIEVPDLPKPTEEEFLEIELQECIEKEDFERAAVIRDKIEKLKKTTNG